MADIKKSYNDSLTEPEVRKLAGGGLESPTLNQFITARLAAIRRQALEMSRKKTETTPVDIEKVYGKEYVKQVLQGYVDDAQARLNTLKRQERERNKRIQSPEFLSPNINTRRQSERLAEAERQLDIAKKMLNGEISYTPAELNNCIANLSEFFPHGLPYGNETLKANPAKYGLKIIDTWDVEPGDIVQHANPKPYHAMLYNGVVDGKHTFNYSTGTMPYDCKSGYGTYRHYPDVVSPDGEHLHDVNVYRYVGTPQDSIQWINEYNELYPNTQIQNTDSVKSTGGPLYPFPLPAVKYAKGGKMRQKVVTPAQTQIVTST